MNEKHITVVLVTYNAQNWIDYCLGEIYNKTEISIICIDNASTDSTRKILKSKYPSVKLIENRSNQGFGRANNIGFQHFLKSSEKYLFLLNQDAKISHESLLGMAKIMDDNQELGILSPIHRGKDNLLLEHNFARYMSPNNTPQLIDDLMLSQPLKKYYKTKFVNAALWMLSRSCVEKVGKFDPIFPHYGEDEDYCRRTLRLGLIIGVSPDIKANHARPSPEKRAPESVLSTKPAIYYTQLILLYKDRNTRDWRSHISFFRDLAVKLTTSLLNLEFQDASMELQCYLKAYRSLFLKKYPLSSSFGVSSETQTGGKL